MKKTISILLVGLFLFAGFQLSAQEKSNRDGLVPPAAFNYQAVLRDASGVILADEAVDISIEILEATVDGIVVYTQEESLSTNAQGLLNIIIGNGSDLDAIDWSGNKYFIRLSVNGTEMGTSELLTVPYAMYAETAVFAENVQWGLIENTAFALQDEVVIGMAEEASAQLHIVRDDAYDNSQVYIQQNGTGDAAIGLDIAGFDNTFSIGIDQSDANKLKISSTYGPSEGEESITITSDDKVGIGTSNPDAQLHVEGGMKVGATGIEIGDIIELTDTTSTANSWLSIAWPAGYTKENTRVLSVEIQRSETVHGYKSLGYSISGVEGNIYVSLSTYIYLYYPDDVTMKGQNYRITLMRVQ
ncbi:MAG: hypothetical protein PF448_13245 [Bacteroidales bacterium]|jgi:hypothetical protein|nr:hypothetical protein [Bacteroidales bacterium]